MEKQEANKCPRGLMQKGPKSPFSFLQGLKFSLLEQLPWVKAFYLGGPSYVHFLPWKYVSAHQLGVSEDLLSATLGRHTAGTTALKMI